MASKRRNGEFPQSSDGGIKEGHGKLGNGSIMMADTAYARFEAEQKMETPFGRAGRYQQSKGKKSNIFAEMEAADEVNGDKNQPTNIIPV